MIKWMLRLIKFTICVSNFVSWLCIAFTFSENAGLAIIFSVLSIFVHALAFTSIDELAKEFKGGR